MLHTNFLKLIVINNYYFPLSIFHIQTRHFFIILGVFFMAMAQISASDHLCAVALLMVVSCASRCLTLNTLSFSHTNTPA